MVQIDSAGFGAHQHPIHFAVEPVEEKPQELLSVLLAEKKKRQAGFNQLQERQGDPIKGASLAFKR